MQAKTNQEADPLFIPNPNLKCLLCKTMYKEWKLVLNGSDGDLPHFEFPDDSDTFKSWCRNIRSVFRIAGQIYDQRLCSLHFAPTEFVNANKLKPKAVPVVHTYKYYFKDVPVTAKTRKCPQTTSKDICYLCDRLKQWKVKLKPQNEHPIKLFPFPEHALPWVTAIRTVYATSFYPYLPHDELSICSMHFEDEDFADEKHQELKPDAVPMVHKYSHYFSMSAPTRALEKRVIPTDEGEKTPPVCLLCVLLAKWKVKLKRPSDLTVKLFPLPSDSKPWRAAIKAVYMDKAISDDSMICALHFKSEDFYDKKRTQLKKGAVPTVQKYGYYFNIALPKKTLSQLRQHDAVKPECLLCPLLKRWNVVLTRPSSGEPVKLFVMPKDGQWMAAIKKVHDIEEHADEKIMVCALHFRHSDFVDDSRQILKPMAVPIILPRSFYKKQTPTVKPSTPPPPPPEKKRQPPSPNLAIKRVKVDLGDGEVEEYTEIDWMKF